MNRDYAFLDPVERHADLVVESVEELAEQTLQPLVVRHLVETKSFCIFEKNSKLVYFEAKLQGKPEKRVSGDKLIFLEVIIG